MLLFRRLSTLFFSIYLCLSISLSLLLLYLYIYISFSFSHFFHPLFLLLCFIYFYSLCRSFHYLLFNFSIFLKKFLPISLSALSLSLHTYLSRSHFISLLSFYLPFFLLISVFTSLYIKGFGLGKVDLSPFMPLTPLCALTL